MPPKVSGQRRPRLSDRGRDRASPSSSGLANLQKPNLPPLQGTPSSRRQYSYGAAAEPQPSRPEHGLQRGQVVDLSNAVRSVLNRNEEEDDSYSDLVSPLNRRKPLPPEVDVLDDDELAQVIVDGRERGSPKFPRSTALEALPGSETDDVRSFGMESEFYGNATIASTPGVVERPGSTSQPSKATSPSTTSPRPRRASRRAPRRLTSLARENLFEDEDAALQLAASATLSSRHPKSRPSDADPGALESDEDHLAKPLLNHHLDTAKLPMSKRTRFGLGDRAKGNRSLDAASVSATRIDVGISSQEKPPDSSPAATGQLKSTRMRRRLQKAAHLSAMDSFVNAPVAEVSEEEECISPESGRWLGRAAAVSASLSAWAKRNSNGIFPFAERNVASEEDIDRAEQEAEEHRHRQRTPEAEQDWLRHWPWSHLFSQPSAQYQNSNPSPTQIEFHSEPSPVSSWRLLLDPRTYIRAIFKALELTWNWVTALVGNPSWVAAQDGILSVCHSFAIIFIGFVVMFSALAISTAILSNFKTSTAEDLWQPVPHSSPLWSYASFVSRIGDYLPSVSWPAICGRYSLADLGNMDGMQGAQLDTFVERIRGIISALERTDRLHEESLQKLEKIVPKVVHMQLRDGKPVVATEFWHALRSLIHEDDSFLTFEKHGKGFVASSNPQWNSFVERLVKDPALLSKINHSAGAVEEKLEHSLSGLWDSWVKDNESKIQQILKSASDQGLFIGSQRELDERLEVMIGQRVRDPGGQSFLADREAFLRQVTSEMALHRSEIKAELAELQPRLEMLVRESVDAASRSQPRDPSQIAGRPELAGLVNSLVREALVDFNLETLTTGKIFAHWDAELKHQVNYFSVGAGAVVDKVYTSPNYDALKPPYFSLPYRNSMRSPLPPVTALLPWTDEGDCWCAALSEDHNGKPHGALLSVLLGYRIIPQHIVIQHILPGATTDPGARPRDMEVFVDIADDEVRERVRDFSAAHFPESLDDDDDGSPAVLPKRFIQIGRFVYQGAESHDGVYVHRLSPDLVELGAGTDHVIVRSLHNYGAANHTCFYRVLLYGHNVELAVPQEDESF